ncbi:MAG TPA: hypothetical protein VLE49_16700 [Anaerolineales bacterium]|nr:hypothetical protein [Anaerolineales bacterium]
MTSTSSPPATKTPIPADDPIPVLAYYYIWFDTQSWDRAKMDYPLLGRYSSDDADVMRQHIQWAKEAGIDGFIVSWKDTDKLNRRLAQLVKIAEQEDFKLAINYESLDFERIPLPVDQVDADLSYFMDQYADHQVFDIFEKPMVIWSGTSEFSVEEVQNVVQDKRERILVLASEKNVKGYQRLAKLIDGNAYYWSSVNPDTHSGYPEKLMAMGQAVHQNGGLWVAPAAPGYDSRLLGRPLSSTGKMVKPCAWKLRRPSGLHPRRLGSSAGMNSARIHTSSPAKIMASSILHCWLRHASYPLSELVSSTPRQAEKVMTYGS